MASVLHFGGTNSGFQAGIINGPVNTEFHHHAPPERPETPPNPLATIPFSRDPDFVERGPIINQLDRKCAAPGSRTALVGLGGVGKSQLAIEYAYRVRERSLETWVFWVHASNAARFEQSYRDIADSVKIPERRNVTANIFKLVHDWLRDDKNGAWVLILDNVDDASFLLEAHSTSPDVQPNSSNGGNARPLVSYLPQCQNGSILITTRNRSAALKLVEQWGIINIEPMEEAHAMALLTKKLENLEKLGIKFQEEDIADLVAALEFMPLAIAQAAAYISERAPRCSVRQYLEQYRKSDGKRTSLLDHEGGQLRRDREAKNSIIITWQISFDHIRQTRPSAADLLSLMSFFDCQGIPEVLLQNRAKHRNNLQDREEQDRKFDYVDDDFSSQSSESDEFEEDVVALRNFSFISINADRISFEMHGLVQLATRKWLEAHGQLERWKQQFIRKLYKEFPTGEYENWATCQELFPHAISATAQRPEGQDSLRDWASILFKAAWYAWKMGNGVEAEKMSVQAMRVRKMILGQEHEDTLWSMAMVGYVYLFRGQLSKAEELFVQVMETRKKKLGADHPDTLTSMNNLAVTYSQQGRQNEAKKLKVQVMETYKKKLGADHPDTLMSMANLGVTYSEQGRQDEAEKLMIQVMETRKKKLGADHPDTLMSMANLGATYSQQGRQDEAEKIMVQVMETYKKKLGADHPDTLTSMANLAVTYSQQGRQDEAVGLMRKCVGLQQQILGAGHPHSVSSSNFLASLEAEQSGSGHCRDVAEGQERLIS